MIGKEVERNRVKCLLRDGGTSTTYEAEGEFGVVAIRVLSRDLRHDADAVARFMREAKVLRTLHHPIFLDIYGSGTLDDGAPYVITQLPDGESLAERQRRLGGPLGLTHLPLLHQLATGLAAAHEQGLVHRNLKPEILYVSPVRFGVYDEQIKIIEMSLVKIAGEDLTTQGKRLGTPIYMSPECFDDAASADGKADVYSFGVILFEALAGSPPFNGKTPMSIIFLHLHKSPPLLSEQDPTLPPALSTLVNRMLAKAPASRPTMTEVAAELKALCGALRL